MSNLTLRAMKAKHGDSLLLFAGQTKVLIDGGPSGVYKQTLRDQLLELDFNGVEPPQIDLMMVSHIDADHIDGILDLTAELIESREDDREPIVTIEQVWHNSFSDLIASTATESSQQVSAKAASVASVFSKLGNANFKPHESKLVLQSVGQGRRLRLDLEALNISLNKRFKDNIVLQGNADPWICGDLTLSVIGPTQKELDKLRKFWKDELKTILEKEAVASIASAAKLDHAVPNLASIVAIAEAAGKSILLTGDARGDMILKWLEDVGRLKPDNAIHFDIVKLPHHGSDRNVTPEFFERITTDHYVLSGDGRHGNPEPHTFEMLFSARPDLDYTVHLTYGLEELNTHSSFIKEGNVEKLAQVLSDPARMNTLNFPEAGQKYIEIDL
jgi:ribonuclease BN (tRNA processing enzyme)